MKADPATVAAMNAIYPLVLTLKEQTHRQEHIFFAAHYCRLGKKFDKITNEIHAKWLHKLVCWFASHEADPDSSLVSFAVAAANEPGDALANTDDLLTQLNQALLAACTEISGDPVSKKLVHKILCRVEKWRDIIDAEADQIDDLGTALYLQKMK